MVEKDKDVYQQFRQLFDEVHKKVIGNDEVIRDVVISIFAGAHILLESVPGMGKTVLTKVIADTMEMDFKRVQCTPDITGLDITGHIRYDEAKKENTFEKGPVFTNLLLVDEINRAQPKSQSALLEIMAEKCVTIGGVTYKLPNPFTVLATQNPVEQVGTNPLPEAQNDRFLFKTVLKYLSVEEEVNIAKVQLKHEEIRKIFNPPEILIIQDEIKKNVEISDSVLEYAVRIVDTSRKRREVQTGGSPRANIAFLYAAKTKAFLEGRNYVTPDDIRELAFPILRHRILLRPDSKDFGITPDDVIAKILQHVEAPVD